MRIMRSMIFVTLIAIIVFYFMEQSDANPEKTAGDQSKVVQEKRNVQERKVAPIEEKANENLFEGNIFTWMGRTIQELKDEFGEPQRIDRSAYGYDWWVYNGNPKQYIQFGIEGNEIKTVYVTGEDLEIEPVHIGQSYVEINNLFTFKEQVPYSEGISSYTFNLNEEDLTTRPLVKIDDTTFIQLYFDTFTSKLSSIRLLSADTLLKHRPYEVEYRGELPDEPDLTDAEWADVEKGMEQQVFDITNVMRNQHGKGILDWEESVSEVAFLHSKDMAENNYFSHYSLNGDGLKERLAAGDVFYAAAGENIAAQYPDAPAAVEGWLNSEGHREALFNEDYSHIGVGVYRFYYTQNFLGKPN
ncbi:CAP domain-containing protein [Oceanobacillus massiliensis]|uniref:CAP domain-containing protein n=1 Tax=Oceanobacillus massiliensis TaxID=1465765 RepID=UPI00301837CE